MSGSMMTNAKKRIDAENKCSGCEFVRKAHEEFLDNRD